MDQQQYDEYKQNLRQQFAGQKTIELARAMKAAQTDKEEMEERMTRLNTMIDMLRFELIPTKMDEEGIDKITIDGVGTLYTSVDVNASIPADSKHAAYQWLDEHGFGNLVTPTVNSSTLKAFCKEQLKKGTELPSELFKVTPFTRAAIKKA
jgi:hypothetical protein